MVGGGGVFVEGAPPEQGIRGSPELVRRLFTPATAPDGTPLPHAHGWYVQDYRGETLYRAFLDQLVLDEPAEPMGGSAPRR